MGSARKRFCPTKFAQIVERPTKIARSVEHLVGQPDLQKLRKPRNRPVKMEFEILETEGTSRQRNAFTLLHNEGSLDEKIPKTAEQARFYRGPWKVLQPSNILSKL